MSDLTPLSACKNLQSLNLAETRISDINPLSACESLQFLDVSDTTVTDLAPLAKLIQLSISSMGAIPGGLFFAATPASIRPELEKFARFGNPMRTVETLNVIRRKAGLPPFYPPGYPGMPGETEGDNAPKNTATSNKLPRPEEIPPQLAGGIRFEETDGGTIQRATTDVLQLPPPEKLHLYGEARDVARQIVAACARNPNRFAVLATAAERVSSELDDQLTAETFDKFWARGNTLRILFEKNVLAENEDDPDPPALPDDIAALLENFAEVFRKLNARIPAAAAYEAEADASLPAATIANAKPAADALLDAIPPTQTVIDADILEQTKELGRDADVSTPSGVKARGAFVRTSFNIVLALLKGAAKLTWSAVKVAGKTAVVAGLAVVTAERLGKLPALIALLHKYEKPIADFIATLPGGTRLLEWLSEILARWM